MKFNDKLRKAIFIDPKVEKEIKDIMHECQFDSINITYEAILDTAIELYKKGKINLKK